jgi:hypothetical protein
MQTLVITKGHPFERGPFFEMLDALPDVDWTHVEHPAAAAVLEPDYACQFDVFVFYDMPGIRFGSGGPTFVEPSERFKSNLRALTQRGAGLVFLHHAIAGWPAWPEYGELIGGRFLYLPATVRDVPCLDSGYRHRIDHTIRCVTGHPVTDGVPPTFSITDELYLYEVFEDSVTPLLTSDYRFERDNFFSAAKVVLEGKMYDNRDWPHAPGPNCVGWTRTVGASRLVYLQCGDDPVAYANPHFRRLLANAVAWTGQRG